MKRRFCSERWLKNPFWIPFWWVGEFTAHSRTYFSGWIESDVHWGYDLGFDPQPTMQITQGVSNTNGESTSNDESRDGCVFLDGAFFAGFEMFGVGGVWGWGFLQQCAPCFRCLSHAASQAACRGLASGAPCPHEISAWDRRSRIPVLLAHRWEPPG